ncbi:MAG: DUF6249 domain-containing protein [Pseudomonadales bacterium]
MNKLIVTLLLALLTSIAAPSWAQEDGNATTSERSITVEPSDAKGIFQEVVGEIKREIEVEIKKELDEDGDGEIDDTTIQVGSGDGMGLGESLIAFTAIMMSLGMPILILLMVLFFSHRRRRQRLELVKTYLDANRDVPENILAGFDGASGGHLSSGVKMVGLGLGIILAVYLLADNYRVAALGLIPLFIGLSRLVLWKLEGDAEDRSV